MSKNRTYRDIVFTTHAFERMRSRTITEHVVWETITYPQQVITDTKGTKRYIKTIANRRYFVVATFLPKEHKYLVVSTWVRGEDDPIPLVWQLLTAPFKMLWWIISSFLKSSSKK